MPLFKSKVKEKVLITKDLKAIELFLKDAVPSVKQLSKMIAEMKKLHLKELKSKKDPKAVRDLMLKQVMLYDKILKQYEILQLDTDVNGERIKKISNALGKKAKKQMIPKKWLDIIRKSDRWTFDW